MTADLHGILDRRGRLLLGALAILLGMGAGRAAAHAGTGERTDPGRGFLTVRTPRRAILFSGGEPAAWEAEAYSVACDAAALAAFPPDRMEEAARLVGVPVSELRRHAAAGGEGRWLARWINPARAQRISRAAIPGIRVRYDPRRIYPEARMACHLLGGCGYDARGTHGVEWAWDRRLAGSERSLPVRCDARRRPLCGADDLPEVPDPAPLVLTIDYGIQAFLEAEIDRAVADWQAPRALIAVMDPRTGALLGAASRPAYDPNGIRDASPEALWNPLLGWSFEPGSTAKPFAYAEALAEGLVTPETVLDCERGAWRVGYRTLHDHHPYGELPALDVLVKSSNIGMAKIGTILGAERLHRALGRYGFGAPAGLGLAGEEGGRVRPLRSWRRDSEMSIPMGHEFSTTPLQLLCAYNALLTGTWRRPYLVEAPAADRWPGGAAGPSSRPVGLPEPVLASVRDALEQVVVRGTGRAAAVPGARVGGKTGTAQKIAPDGTYRHDAHLCLFVGFAPADAPEFTVLVAIDEPRADPATGGRVAAPVAGRVLAGLLEIRARGTEAPAR